MTELKLKCYSCNYERIIGEREFIEDLQQCPNCGSDNIEILTTEDSEPVKEIDPEERERIVRRKMVIIGGFGTIFLVSAIVLYLITPLIPYTFRNQLNPLIITLGVIGIILLIISLGWATDGECCCVCSG
jgi:hypothetical protein